MNYYNKNIDDFSNNPYINRSRSRRSRRNVYSPMLKIVLIVIVLFIILSVGIFDSMKYFAKKKEAKELENFSTAQMKNDIYIDFSIIGIKKPVSIKGLTKQEVYDSVLGSYVWDMKIYNSNPEIDLFTMPRFGKDEVKEDYGKYMDNRETDNLGTAQEVLIDNPLEDITIKPNKEEYDFPDFVEGQAKKFIDDIYDKYLYVNANEFDKKKVDVTASDFSADFTFKVINNDDYLDDCLSQLARIWDTKAVRGQIESYDATKNEFIFGDDHKGYVIDQDELRKRMINEVNKGNLKSELWTVLKTVEPEGQSAKSRYKFVSVYETWTTDNKKRNKNIDLACRAINGTILKTGQEFSFNNIVGQRTEEKGYDYAPAYLEGQVVEELGGGVCQVSTTLYNAVFNAGLTTTYRKSHTFEPTYISPGLDATVSFHGPDYRFINNSEYSVGIKAKYSKEKVKVEIFAVPLLKEGETQYLASKKIQDLEYPTISIITEGHASKGSQGSEWQVFKIVKQDDVEVSRTVDHQTTYQGHTPTAFEEYTYIDDDGLIATSKFVETLKEESTKRGSTKVETTKRVNTIQTIAPVSE